MPIRSASCQSRWGSLGVGSRSVDVGRGPHLSAGLLALSESAPSTPLDAVEQDASVKAVGRDAVERVYRREGPKIWRALVAYSGDVDIANDAFAEALAQ